VAHIVLQPGKERPVRQCHPWIFSGAIARVQGKPEQGDSIDILDHTGEWLARGTWSAESQIRARLFTWQADELIDAAMLRRRIERAIAGRKKLNMLGPDRACRVVYSESDGLPGLVVDSYGEYLTVQLLTQGMAVRQTEIVQILVDLLAPRGIFERSDADIRDKEGLPPAEGLLWGMEPPAQLSVRDASGQISLVDLQNGQKTGAYLDQALNRARVAAYSAGAEVLDCFCYAGGFSVAAAKAGARRITAADSSTAALDLVAANFAANGLDAVEIETVAEDVFRLLRQYRQIEQQFDLIILDPPKFAYTQGQIDRATRGYKDINLIAMQLLRPGGILATFSCSGLISADLFQKVIFGAALDAHRDVHMIERLSQAPDHPLLLTFPEGEYLKGLICRVW
jgi:23S rRNA (cytosine1962-C5)-methyltransferase